MRSVDLTPAKLASYDCVLIATDHTSYDYDAIARNAKLVVDTRNATRRVKENREKIVNCSAQRFLAHSERSQNRCVSSLLMSIPNLLV